MRNIVAVACIAGLLAALLIGPVSGQTFPVTINAEYYLLEPIGGGGSAGCLPLGLTYDNECLLGPNYASISAGFSSTYVPSASAFLGYYQLAQPPTPPSSVCTDTILWPSLRSLGHCFNGAPKFLAETPCGDEAALCIPRVGRCGLSRGRRVELNGASGHAGFRAVESSIPPR